MSNSYLQRNKIYPIHCEDAAYAGLAPRQGLPRLGWHPHVKPAPGSDPNLFIGAIWKGEKRPPKRGEWFFSGAEILAYRAPANLDSPYCIAQLVRYRTKTVQYDIEEIGQPKRSGQALRLGVFAPKK